MSRFDEVFRISVGLKGLDALLEIVGGLLLLLISPHLLDSFAHWITRSELKEDPHDFISNLILHTTHHLTSSSMVFAAIYLLAHGLIKIVVVIAVLLNKFWAYPAMIVVVFAFVIYQVLQILHRFSLGYTLLSIFDVFVIVMTVLEWRKQIHKRETTKTATKE